MLNVCIMGGAPLLLTYFACPGIGVDGVAGPCGAAYRVVGLQWGRDVVMGHFVSTSGIHHDTLGCGACLQAARGATVAGQHLRSGRSRRQRQRRYTPEPGTMRPSCGRSWWPVGKGWEVFRLESKPCVCVECSWSVLRIYFFRLSDTEKSDDSASFFPWC